MARTLIGALIAGALLQGCGIDPVVTTARQPSVDAALDLVMHVRIEPGGPARQHEVFVGIGRHGDNPAQRYFHAEYTYFLDGHLDWRIQWESEERVRLELLSDEHLLAVKTYVRDPESGRFGELLERGGAREGVA